MTLCVLAQKATWSRARLMGLGLATGAGHVAISVLLGFGIVFAGVVFSQGLSSYITFATGLAMLVIGAGYGMRKLLSHDQEDYIGEVDRKSSDSSGRGVPYFLVLGGALSPDLSILPVFLLALPAGQWVVVDVALVFAAASILSLTALIIIGSMGVAKALSRIPPKYNDSLVGFVIAAVGAYVLVAG